MNRVTICMILFWVFVGAESRNLLEAYFKHRAAHNSINNDILSTHGKFEGDPDYDVEDAREPGNFVVLREPKEKGFLGLSQAVSPHRDELRAASMIQKLHRYSKRLSGHI